MKPKTSLVWSYFVEIDDAKARCKLCDKVYSRKGRTTTALKSHLKAIHAEEFAQFKKLDDAAKLSSEMKKEKNEESMEFVISPTSSTHSDEISPSASVRSKRVSETLSSDRKRFKKNEEDFHEVPKTSREALDPLHQISEAKNVQSTSLRTQEDEEDECVLYTKLLAKKLRRYPQRMRERIMHKIDGLLLDNPYPETPSVSQQVPYQFYRNSPPSPVYVSTLHNTQAGDEAVGNAKETHHSIEIQTDMSHVTYMVMDMKNSTPKNK